MGSMPQAYSIGFDEVFLMPIYEFLCLKCQSKFEVLRTSTQKRMLKCPQCGSAEVRYIFSSFSLGSNHQPEGSSRKVVSPCSTCRSKNCNTCG